MYVHWTCSPLYVGRSLILDLSKRFMVVDFVRRLSHKMRHGSYIITDVTGLTAQTG